MSHMRRRGKGNCWELRVPNGRDTSGKRQSRFVSFRGTKRAAEVRLAELVTAVNTGTDVEPSKLTVAELVRSRITQWLESGTISTKTAERYRELAENQIIPHLGTLRLQKLKPINIETWHTTMRTRGRKDGKAGVAGLTSRAAHRVLSKALREAARNELVLRNVATFHKAPTPNPKDMRVLVGDEIGALIDKLRGRVMYAPAITALFTGLRRGELLALRWRNTDLDGAKTIHVCEAIEQTKEHGVRFKKPKTKNGTRDVSLPAIVVEALRDHRQAQLELRLALGLGKMQPGTLMFPAEDGGPRSPRAFSKAWAVVAEDIGLKVSFHSLRHTHASQLIDAGINIVMISRRLGHAGPNVTLQVYSHMFGKTDDKAAAAIDAALKALGRPA